LILCFYLPGCDRDGVGGEGRYYTLGNGMEVILVENQASPMISSIVCVKAGSIYENGTNNGVSHLLEHLLFDGTGERTRIEIMDGIEDHGGYLNATTRDDHTAYILLIPTEHAETGLSIQADMLFNSIFPDSEVVKERKVVTEEINKDRDNPYYVSEKYHRNHLYRGTPFMRPVIGFRNIIASMSKEEIIRYYRERYVPENMIIFVTGDFRTEIMLADLERIFGVVPPGNDPETIEDVELPRRTNEIYYLDANSEVSYVTLSFDAPGPNDPDYYPFDYFVRTLSYHDGAPLQSSLKAGPDPLAFSVSADLTPHHSFSTFTVSVTTKPGSEERVVQTVLELLEENSAREPNESELRSVMVDIKSGEYFLRERYHYYGLMKAPYIVSAGFEFIDSYIDRMEEVTPQMIRKVAEQNFAKPRFVATVVGPMEKRITKPDETGGDGSITREVMRNGMRVVVKEEVNSDIFAVYVLAGNRAYLESADQSGSADFLSRMLLRGTASMNRNKLSGALADIGASVTVVDDPYIPYDDYYTSRRYSFIRFETMAEYWRDGLHLLSDMIRNPALDTLEISGTRREMLSLISQREESTYKTARRLFFETLFQDHPFSQPILGTEEDVSSISEADLRWLHKLLYAPNNLIVSVVGGVPSDSVLSEITGLFADMMPVELPGKTHEIPGRITSLRTAEKRLQKEQAYIYMGNFLPGIENEDVPAIRIMMAILSERLALELREKQGLAYSVGASAQFARGFGWYAVTMGTEKSNYQRAVSGIRREIDRLRSQNVDEETLTKVINRTRGRALMKRLSSINRASFLGLNEFLLDDYSESENELEKLKDVDVADVQRVARQYLHAYQGVLVAVR
jgi:predicted Zn-dependent peptidase